MKKSLRVVSVLLPLSTLCSVDRVSCHSPRRDTEGNEWSEGTEGPSDSRERGGEDTEKKREDCKVNPRSSLDFLRRSVSSLVSPLTAPFIVSLRLLTIASDSPPHGRLATAARRGWW